MAKDKLTDYSATAASNTDIGGVDLGEGTMVPADINDALREQMSHLADFAAGTTGIDVLNLQDDDASASVKLQAPATVTTTVTFTMPGSDGSANQMLKTDGSGALSFAAVDTASIADDAVTTAKINAAAVGTTEIADDAVTNAKIATDAVNADSVAASAIGASELNVSGNGTSGQVLASDGDGTFSWADSSDTTYTAGDGLDLSGTVFSHEDTSSQASVNNSGSTFIQDITLDTYGHVTAITSADASTTANYNEAIDTNTGTASISGETTVQTTTITPSSTSARIFVTGTVVVENTSNDSEYTTKLKRGGTQIGFPGSGFTDGAADTDRATITIAFIDHPNSTSEQTYTYTVSATGSGTNSHKFSSLSVFEIH